MPCVLDVRHGLLYFGVVVGVFSRGVQGRLSVCSSYHCECSFVILCGSSNMYWGLLLTCRIVNPRVDVIWRGYGWFSERVNA